MKILVIQQKRIGDVLVSTTLCNNLRRLLPDAEIHYLIYSFTKDMVVGNPNIDEIVLFEDSDRTLVNILRFALKIRRNRYDVIIDPYMKPESRFFSMMSGAKTRVSFKSSAGIYNVVVPLRDYPIHECGTVLTNRLNLLRPVIGEDVELDHQHRIFLSQEEVDRGHQLLQAQGLDPERPIAVFGIFGSVPDKSYPGDYMMALLEWFQDRYDAQIMLNYFPEQTEEALRFYESMKNKENVYPDLASQTLRELAAVLSSTTLYIGNDSGHTHIAKSMNVPTFTILSPFIARYSWGVLDQLDAHDSVDIIDMVPEEVEYMTRRQIVPYSAGLYLKMRPEMVIPKLDAWLRSIGVLARE